VTGTWRVASGRLPVGLRLSSGGTISGVPARAGTSHATLRFTDFVPRSFTRRYSFTIERNPPVIRNAALPAARIGTSYSAQLRTADNRPGTWRIAAGALPQGLTLTSAGAVWGTPAVSGPFPFTVRFTDRYGQQNTHAFKITSSVDPPVIVTTVMPNGEYKSPYTTRLRIQDQRAGVWSLTDGQLPAGLTLTADGSITGTPTSSGTFSFTVRFTDPYSQASSRNYGIVIDFNPPVIQTTALPRAASGSPYTAQLQTQDQRSGTWSITDGTLPAGLTMSPGGSLTGTPAAGGSTTLTMLFTDRLGRTASKSYELLVGPGPAVISTTSVPFGTVGAPYETPLALAVERPGTWAIGQGQLPPGLILSPDGTLTGIPTGAMSVPVTVTFTDSDGFIAERPLTVTVNPPPSTLVTQAWNSPFGDPALSGDGRFVAFRGIGDSQTSTVLRRDLISNTVDSGYATSLVVPAISADGHYIVANSFTSLWWQPVTRDAFYRHEANAAGWFLRPASLRYDSLSYDVGGGVDSPAISADGRYIAFASTSTEVVRAGGQQTSGRPNVYLRDMDEYTTRLISTAVDGSFTASGRQPALSGDGRYVAFTSDDANLVAGDTNNRSDIFVRDMTTGSISLISRNTDGSQRTTDSALPAISADGRYIAYVSDGVHVYDRATNSTTTVIAGGATTRISLSADGQYVAFDSTVPGSGDTNALPDVFRWNRQTGTTMRISTSRYDLPSADLGGTSPSLSADGTRIAFVTRSRLQEADTDNTDDVYVQDIPPGI
jgi:Tol biopolymer transport system component